MLFYNPKETNVTTTVKKTDPLELWLDRVKASKQWEVTTENTGATVTGYLINRRLAIVVRYAEHLGWELLVPSSKKNDIGLALGGAAIALEVYGCQGLIENGPGRLKRSEPKTCGRRD